MKKSLILFAVTMFMVSCSNEESVDTLSNNSPGQQVDCIRSFEEAFEIANSSIAMVDGSAKTRFDKQRKIDIKNIKICRDKNNTRSGSVSNDTLMYVFNFTDEQGFAVVSASKNTEGLLAVTEKGNYNPDSLSEIGGFNIFMDLAKSYVKNAEAIGGPKRSPVRPLEKDSVGCRIGAIAGPYISVNWGQRYPEGELCSNGLCGCTNTSIAQILSYYEYPTQITLSHLGNQAVTQTLNWSQIKGHQTGHTISSCSTTGIHSTISNLLRELGYLNNSEYSYDSYGNPFTGTYRTIVPTTMTGLGYQTGSWSAYNFSFIKQQLDSEHLFMMSGQDTYKGRHAWTLDGYKTEEEVIYHYLQYGIGMPWQLAGIDVINTTNYCHFNWGWYGSHNGYYLSGVFDAGNSGNYENYLYILPIYRN